MQRSNTLSSVKPLSICRISKTAVIVWIFALYHMNRIPVVNSQNTDPACRQLDNAKHLYTASCNKIWLENIDQTIMYALKYNKNFEHDIRKLKRQFYTITIYCSYKLQLKWDLNAVRANDQSLCGIRMVNAYRQNIINTNGHTSDSIHIKVDSLFALNITFMYFNVDEYFSETCEDITVRTAFAYGSTTCKTHPVDGVCGHRHPWSVFIPSSQVVIYVIYYRLINPVQFHVAYQVMEKCNNFVSLRVAHILTIQELDGKYSILYTHILTC